MTSTVTRIYLRNLSTSTTDPNRSGELMLEAAKLSVKSTKRMQAFNLVRGLRIRRVGTHQIEKAAKTLTQDKERNEPVVIKLLDIVVKSSEAKSLKAKQVARKGMRRAVKNLPAGWIRKSFEDIVRTEVSNVWEERRKKNAKKKDHLERKYKPRKEQKFFRGVPIGDSELGEDEEVIEVVSHGIQLSDDEKEFLKLPKCATDFVKLDPQKIKTSIQVTAAKLRMSLKEQEEVEEEGGERAPQEPLLASRRVYDPEDRSVDMSKKRVTDMENCRRITVPDAAEASKESKIQVLIDNLEDVAKKAGREEQSCLRAGSSNLSTMTEQQRRGKLSLIRREKNEELVLVASDKSGKLIPMSPELYRQSMEPHIRGDSVHSREDVLKAEKQFNGASRQIQRAFKFGKTWGHEDRFVTAGKAENNEVPDLNQLVKDHKPTLQTRPVCRAQVTQAPNGPIAELLCEILNPFVEEADKESRTEVKSQEELCSEMNKVNARIREEGLRRGPFQTEGNLVVGSKDVEAHYPNIDIDLAASEVKREIEESDLEVNVDTSEVALFLACSMTVEEIEEEGLTELVHKRRFKNGARPGLTCKAITGGPAVRQQDRAWMQPVRAPERAEKMKMIGCLMKVAINLVMTNHFYSFENVIRKQSKGGAIGNKLTERLGKILMKRHCRKYVSLLARLGLEAELLKCYVDDTTDVCVAIDPGVRFEDGELVRKDELVEDDMNVADDERTLNVLREVANSIFECVQFTVEYPSKNENGKVPILDLEVAVIDNQLIHEHYEKPCAAKMVIPFSSAHSKKMKMAVLVEEGVRRLRNTARGLDEEKRRSVMEKWISSNMAA